MTSNPPELPRVGKIDFGDQSIDVDYYLTKDYVDIGEARDELPAVIEYLNSQLQYFVESKINAKHILKKTEAIVYFRYRDGGRFLEEGFAGKATDKALGYAIAVDAKVEAAVKKYAELSGWVLRLTNLMAALQMKMDLVRSSEATSRRLIDPDKETPD